MNRSSLTKAGVAALAVSGLTFGGIAVAAGDVSDSQAPAEVVDLVEDKTGDAGPPADAGKPDDAGPPADAGKPDDADAPDDAEEPDEGEDAGDGEVGSDVAAERHEELTGGTATPADGEDFGQAVAENARDNGAEQSATGQARAEENRASAEERAADAGAPDDAGPPEDAGRP